MGRGLLRALVLLAVGGAGTADATRGGRAGHPLPPCSAPDRAGVDRVEEGRAVLLAPGGRRSWTVLRSRLPPGTREGDVVLGGRLRPDCRRMLREQVGRLRARLTSGAPGGTRALTAGGEP